MNLLFKESNSYVQLKQYVASLSKESVPNNWDQLLQYCTSSEQIYNIFSIPMIKDILSNYSNGNIQTLIHNLAIEQNEIPLNVNRVLNYTRILNRFLPFIFEGSIELQDSLFWNNSKAPLHGNTGGQLVHSCIQLFIKGCSLEGEDSAHFLKEHLIYRIDLLRFTMTCLSLCIYSDVNQLDKVQNKFIYALQTDVVHEWIQKLIQIASQPPPEPLLPYEYVFKSQTPSILVELCIQTLALLVTFLPSYILNLQFEMDFHSSNLILALTNSFKSFVLAHKTFLPFSRKSDNCLQESLIVLYEAIQVYPKLVTQMTQEQQIILMETLVYSSIQNRSKQTSSILRISYLLFWILSQSSSSLPILLEKMDPHHLSTLARKELLQEDTLDSWNGTWMDLILSTLLQSLFSMSKNTPMDMHQYLLYSTLNFSLRTSTSTCKSVLYSCLHGISHSDSPNSRDYYIQILENLCQVEANLQSVGLKLQLMKTPIQFQDILNKLSINQVERIQIPQFQNTNLLQLWIKSYIWGIIYQRNQNGGDVEYSRVCPPIWAGTYPKLFKIQI